MLRIQRGGQSPAHLQRGLCAVKRLNQVILPDAETAQRVVIVRVDNEVCKTALVETLQLIRFANYDGLALVRERVVDRGLAVGRRLRAEGRAESTANAAACVEARHLARGGVNRHDADTLHVQMKPGAKIRTVGALHVKLDDAVRREILEVVEIGR